MARKARLEYEGAVYHVMNRGDRGGKVFRDRLDYELLLNTIGEVCKRTGCPSSIARTQAGKDSALRPLVRQLATLTERKTD